MPEVVDLRGMIMDAFILIFSSASTQGNSYNVNEIHVVTFLNLRCFDTVFLAPYLTFLNDILIDFPPSDRRETFTTCWA